jgi:hypothetical protein
MPVGCLAYRRLGGATDAARRAARIVDTYPGSRGSRSAGHGRGAVSRISDHASPATWGQRVIVGQNPRYQGDFDPR